MRMQVKLLGVELDGKRVAPALLVRKALLCGPRAPSAEPEPQLLSLAAPLIQLHLLQRTPPRCATGSTALVTGYSNDCNLL